MLKQFKKKNKNASHKYSQMQKLSQHWRLTCYFIGATNLSLNTPYPEYSLCVKLHIPYHPINDSVFTIQ